MDTCGAGGPDPFSLGHHKSQRLVSSMAAGCHLLSLSGVQRARRGVPGRALSCGVRRGESTGEARAGLRPRTCAPPCASAHASAGRGQGHPPRPGPPRRRDANLGRGAAALRAGGFGLCTRTRLGSGKRRPKNVHWSRGGRGSAARLRYHLSGTGPSPGAWGLGARPEAPLPRRSGEGPPWPCEWAGEGASAPGSRQPRGRDGRQGGRRPEPRAVLQPLPLGTLPAAE